MRSGLLLLAACGSSARAIDAAPCEPATVYLDRQGGAYDHGQIDNAGENLAVVVDGPRTLPPWPGDDVAWTETAQCIRDALAPFAVTVTEQDPGTTLHFELVFTTSYWGGTPLTYLAPSACRPGHEIEVIFGDALPTANDACETALAGFAELAALLSPSANCLDFTSPAMECGLRYFVAGMEQCVDESDQASPCRCGGTTEDTFAALSARFPPCRD